jgi:hypothetical protein
MLQLTGQNLPFARHWRAYIAGITSLTKSNCA